MRLRIKRLRQLVYARFMPYAQMFDDLLGEVAIVCEGLERFQRGLQRFATCVDLRFVLGDPFATAGRRQPKRSDDGRQAQSKSDQGDEDDAETDEQDQVAIRKPSAGRQAQRQRQCCRKRYRAAYSGEGENEYPLP